MKLKNIAVCFSAFALTMHLCNAEKTVDAVYWKWVGSPACMVKKLTMELPGGEYKELDQEEIAALKTMAESGNADAQAILANFHLQLAGRSLEASEILRAQVILANLHLQHMWRNENKSTAQILIKDIKDAKRLFNKAYASFLAKAKSGDAYACLNLSTLHEGFSIFPWNPELSKEWGLKALDILGKKAEQGDEQALTDIARCYSCGIGCDRNPAKAFAYNLKLANLGNIYAIKEIVHSYISGDGVGQDFNEAIKWYTKAADKGDAASCAEIAEIYSGRYAEIPQDPQKEEHWRRMAANRGHAYSQYRMAVRHCWEQVKERNDWLELAAKNNSPEAIKMLSNIKISEGKQHEGFLLLQKAADLNDAEAQYNLGEAYEKGIGTEKNLIKAKTWYEKSAGKGNFEAKEKLKNGDF